MTTKHTPGPRGLVETLRDLQDNVHGEAIVSNAELATMERQAVELSARTAGPLSLELVTVLRQRDELLAALERFVGRADAARADGTTHIRVGTGDGGDIGEARAAIARAKGEKS